MSLTAYGVSVGQRLNSVSASLQSGQITAICGPNGAGKSTLLRVLGGLITPDSGVVEFNGSRLSSLDPRQRAKDIGYLPQEPVVAWDVAVRNVIALGRLPHRDRGRDQIERVIDALDLARFANTPISRLSGGERARVLLARVLAGEPKWVLADEPLAALDLGHQLDLLRHLRKEADKGRGIVLVLHDLALAMNHADRVVLLDEGNCVADDKPDIALASGRLVETFGISGQWLGTRGALALAIQSRPTD